MGWWLLGVVLLLPCVLPSAIDIDVTHIITVCSHDRIYHSMNGEKIDSCPDESKHENPADLFKDLTLWRFNTSCRNETLEEDSKKEPKSELEKNLVLLRIALEVVKSQFYKLIDLVRYTIEDVTKIMVIRSLWRTSFFLSIVGVASAAFCVQGWFFVRLSVRKRYTQLVALSVTIGFGMCLALYLARLFFPSRWFMLPFMLIALYAFSPAYATSSLLSTGLLTLVSLLVPLVGFVVQRWFETVMFFGPVLSIVINTGSILNQIVCLIGLFLDEKLTIVKLFLLPFIQMFDSIFNKNDELRNELKPIDFTTSGLMDKLLYRLDENGKKTFKNPAELGTMISEGLSNTCTIQGLVFQKSCPSAVQAGCESVLKNSKGFTGFVAGVIAFFGKTSSVCGWIGEKACDPFGIIGNCNGTNPSQTAADGYFATKDNFKKFTDSFMMKSLVPGFNMTLFNNLRSLDLFNNVSVTSTNNRVVV